MEPINLMKLTCKNGKISSATEPLIEGNVYELKLECKGIWSVEDTFVSDYPKLYYIWDHFISPAEWREQQINSILDDY